MKFIPIASGSSGNCYLLRNDPCSVAGNVLIELGISWKKILPAIDFQASSLDFALISHSHFDHSLAVKDALKASIDVYMSSESAEALNISGHHRVNILRVGEQKKIGLWNVLPFECFHNAPTLGFVIANEEERLLYITDTAYVKNRFNGITILAIEANFASDILSKNIQKGLPSIVGRRVRKNHLELSTVKEFIRINNMQKTLRQIFLLHLSNGNSSEERFKKEIQELTGVPVYVAEGS